ncbi:unannotated protein [freshwater metagenome]|uniref:Unannotated protein n=1 Tax=freshwater metagenome TaxID=449393 RepID=A0A6J7FP05_9ZZZZ|nr:hypothetical protein [Actinomycetota bacterium]
MGELWGEAASLMSPALRKISWRSRSAALISYLKKLLLITKCASETFTLTSRSRGARV